MYLAGLDIGGTKCAVLIGKEENGKLRVIAKEKISSGKDLEPYDTMEKASVLIEKLCKKNAIDIKEIKAVGISCGGPLDSKRGIIKCPPNLVLWDNIYITDFFEKRFNVPAYLCNDANACALAENRFGAGKGSENMIFLTFGTGMGAGLILNGKLYSGTCDLAGEAGHMRLSQNGPAGFGKTGSFEGWCSGGGITQTAYIAALKKIQIGGSVGYYKIGENPADISAKSVAEAAKAGDETAIEVYKEVGKKLGYAISILIDILNPETIVIGSVFERSKELMESAMLDVIKKEALAESGKVCVIKAAALGDEIGDIAALTCAYEAAKREI